MLGSISRFVLPFVIPIVMALGCSETPPTGPARETPTEPTQGLSLAADRNAKPPRPSEPPPGAELSATELLRDPLLDLLLAGLHDPVSAGEIVSAIEATASNLEDGQTEAARTSIEDAYGAMASYLSAGDVDDEDVIHLDVAERFLDEVESLIGSEKPRGKKSK